MMKGKSAKQEILFGAPAVFLVCGAISLSPVQADSRPDFVVAVQKLPQVLEPMTENSNVHERIFYNIA